jgi:hypothetical protein
MRRSAMSMFFNDASSEINRSNRKMWGRKKCCFALTGFVRLPFLFFKTFLMKYLIKSLNKPAVSVWPVAPTPKM